MNLSFIKKIVYEKKEKSYVIGILTDSSLIRYWYRTQLHMINSKQYAHFKTY